MMLVRRSSWSRPLVLNLSFPQSFFGSSDVSLFLLISLSTFSVFLSLFCSLSLPEFDIWSSWWEEVDRTAVPLCSISSPVIFLSSPSFFLFLLLFLRSLSRSFTPGDSIFKSGLSREGLHHSLETSWDVFLCFLCLSSFCYLTFSLFISSFLISFFFLLRCTLSINLPFITSFLTLAATAGNPWMKIWCCVYW